MTIERTAPLPSALPAARTPRRSAVILVDVGYLIAQTAQAMCGEPRRGSVRLRNFGIHAVHELVQAAADDGLDVLRVYWYDGAPDHVPNQQQRVVGRQARVKLRMGYQVHGTQKGVDRLIQRDISSLSANKAVTDIVLVSGDQDLMEEFDDAGQHGIVMRLWGIAAGDSGHSQSSALIRAADEWRLFDSQWAARIAHVRGAEGSEPAELQPGLDPLLAEALDGPAPGQDPQETRIVTGAQPASAPTVPAAAPSPAPAPKPTAPAARPAIAPSPAAPAAAASHPAAPATHTLTSVVPPASRLAYSVGPSGSKLHVGPGSPGCAEAGRQVFDVLQSQFAEQWTSILSELKERSRRGYLQLPVKIDAELMDSAEGILDRSLRDSEADRIAVREGLWERVAAS